MCQYLSLLNKPASLLSSGAVADTLEKMGSAIVIGNYPVGSVLPMESELVEKYGVSRTVVREAVKILTVKGMVKTARRYGTVVRPIGDWNLLDSAVLSWHSADSPTIQIVYRELSDILSIIMPQAALKIAVKKHDMDMETIRIALSALAEQDSRLLAQAEYSVWGTIINGLRPSFAHFEGMVYELFRLTYILEIYHGVSHPRLIEEYKALLSSINSSQIADTELFSRLILTDFASFICARATKKAPQ